MRKVNSFYDVKLALGLGFLLILAGCGSMGAKKHWCKEDATLLSGSKQQTVKPFRVAFYNLENLFDTVDGPNDDAEFLPNSANAWNGDRYNSKLRNMAKVIDSIAPSILGLVELENAFVLEDLRANSSVMKGKFEIAHRESPDLRGIDVALMYNAELFRISGIYMTPITLPDGYATRNIMRVHLVEKGTGDSLAVFINHWPSRRGGAASAASRMVAATALAQTLQNNPTIPANYLIMGDFNDEPDAKSINEGLQSKQPDDSIVPSNLYNLSYNLQFRQHLWTNKFQDHAGIIDQIIVSGTLLKSNIGIYTTMDAAHISQNDFLFVDDEKYLGKKLFRTYIGMKYNGGFSDHLPVYLDLLR